MTASYLRLTNVAKSHNGLPVVRNVSLDLRAGESIAILGPSGIGKTTLLRIVAGLEIADSGEVWIGDELATRGSEIYVPAHRRSIGFVFQDLALWPHMTIAKSLEFVLTSATPTVDQSQRRRMIEEMLRLVQIDRLGDRHPHQLSGGEQQRAAFARALVHRPRLLLLDEPFSSLDADLRQEMRTTLSDLRATLGFTLVFVTHDRTEAPAVGDRTLELTRVRNER